MSKAVSKGAHWLPRHSKYSLHGHGNGRVDVQPPDAIENLYAICDQIGDGEERIAALRTEAQTLSDALNCKSKYLALQSKFNSQAPTDPELQQLRARIAIIDLEKRRVRSHVNSLKTLLRAPYVDFATAFLAIARAELAPLTFENLSEKANRLVHRCRSQT